MDARFGEGSQEAAHGGGVDLNVGVHVEPRKGHCRCVAGIQGRPLGRLRDLEDGRAGGGLPGSLGRVIRAAVADDDDLQVRLLGERPEQGGDQGRLVVGGYDDRRPTRCAHSPQGARVRDAVERGANFPANQPETVPPLPQWRQGEVSPCERHDMS